MQLAYSQALTILVVDLDIGYQLWLTELLIDAGYRVLPALSASQASALIAECGVSVAVLVMNPNLNGTAELARSIRQDQSRLRVVAAVEACAGDQVRPPEVDAVVVKPTPASDLKALGDHLVNVILRLVSE